MECTVHVVLSLGQTLQDFCVLCTMVECTAILPIWSVFVDLTKRRQQTSGSRSRQEDFIWGVDRQRNECFFLRIRGHQAPTRLEAHTLVCPGSSRVTPVECCRTGTGRARRASTTRCRTAASIRCSSSPCCTSVNRPSGESLDDYQRQTSFKLIRARLLTLLEMRKM